MKTPIPCELRDLDGSYLLVEPLGSTHGLILDSNVAPKGEVFYKSSRLTWSAASEDLGGWTRLVPAEVLETIGDRVLDRDDLLKVLTHEQELRYRDHRRTDSEGEAIDPSSLPEREGGPVSPDPRAEFLRLAMHYRKEHEKKKGKTRWVARCTCPKFRLPDESANVRLHGLIWVGLLRNQLPTLPRIVKAIRDAQGRAERVA